MVDDVEDEWMSGDDFDLVHLRHMSPILKDVRKLVGTAIQSAFAFGRQPSPNILE